MADLLSIGSSAANAFKNAIDVTSNNVANVATEGYNRQRAEIVSNATHALTSSYNGGGSRVESVERIYASYIQTQLVNSYSLKPVMMSNCLWPSRLKGWLRVMMKGFRTL